MDHVKHYPYEESASMYVSKYVCDTKNNWGIIEAIMNKAGGSKEILNEDW